MTKTQGRKPANRHTSNSYYNLLKIFMMAMSARVESSANSIIPTASLPVRNSSQFRGNVARTSLSAKSSTIPSPSMVVVTTPVVTFAPTTTFPPSNTLFPTYDEYCILCESGTIDIEHTSGRRINYHNRSRWIASNPDKVVRYFNTAVTCGQLFTAARNSRLSASTCLEASAVAKADCGCILDQNSAPSFSPSMYRDNDENNALPQLITINETEEPPSPVQVTFTPSPTIKLYTSSASSATASRTLPLMAIVCLLISLIRSSSL
jgi:hypothetical protein